VIVAEFRVFLWRRVNFRHVGLGFSFTVRHIFKIYFLKYEEITQGIKTVWWKFLMVNYELIFLKTKIQIRYFSRLSLAR
jgi:hypothetical protein